MTQKNTNPIENKAVEEAHARARALAEQQGVRPISFDELLGDPNAGDPAKEDVDDFAQLRREWRADEGANRLVE